MADFDPRDVVQPAAPQSGDFDPADVVSSAPPPAPSGVAAPPPTQKSDFDPADVVSPPTADHSDIQKLAEERTDAVVGGSDIDYLAKKHGVDPDWLRSKIGWFGGVLAPEERHRLEYVGESLKTTAGVAGEALGFGVPQGAYKKFATDPNQERALDDLQNLIEERKSKNQKIGDFALGMTAPVGIAGKVVTEGTTAAKLLHAAEATGLGAAAGAAHSRQGEELPAATIGGAVGLGFAGAAALTGHLAAKWGMRSAEARQVLLQSTEDSVSRSEAAWSDSQEAEGVLSDLVLGNKQVRTAARSGDRVQFLDEVEPEEIKHLASLFDGEKVPANLVKQMGEEPAKAWLVTQDAVGKFDTEIGTGARGGVSDYIQREGEEQAAEKFANLRKSEYLDRAISEVSPDQVGSLNWLHRAGKFISDYRYMIQSIDDRLGTRFAPLWDELSAAHNRFTSDLRATSIHLNGLNKIRLAAEKQPTLDGEEFSLYDSLRSGGADTSKLTDAQQTAVQAWRDGFEILRKRANKLGLPIEKLTDEGYVPRKAVDPVEYVKRMDTAGDKLGLDINSDESIQHILDSAQGGEGPAADYVKGLEISHGGAVEDVAGVREALHEMSDLSRTGSRLETTAGATYQRAGEIPEFLLETDPTKLFMSWAQSTFRHIRYRGILDDIVSAARGVAGGRDLDSRSLDSDVRAQAARYMLNHVQDLVGVREGSAAATQGTFFRNFELRAWRAANQATKEGRPVDAFTWRMMSGLPLGFSKLTTQLYTYSLGLKPAKAFEYLLQPYFLGMSEFGVANTGKYFAQGTLDMAKQVSSGLFSGRGIKEFLNSKGLAPAEAGADQIRWMREGLARSGLVRGGQAVLDKFNHISMSLYEQGDLMGRATTYFTSQRLAAGIHAGETGALQTLRRMPVSYRNTILENLRAGEDISEPIAHWMNGHTQFNYNRVSMGEYGCFMGNLFSTFSKWPTSIIGDFAYGLDKATRTGEWKPEMVRLFRKYGAPYIGLHAAQLALRDKLDDSPRTQLVTGDHIDHMAPVTAAAGILNGPPIPRAVYRGFQAARMDDPRATLGAALQTAVPLIPGGVLFRLWFHDRPMLMGHEPEKGSLGHLLSDKLFDK